MRNILKFALLCLYLIISLKVYAQDIEFRHLSTDNGLTHFSVISLYQDERDFIWCGTRNGVSLYNGREFKEYRYQKGDANSLFCNTITAITGDRGGHVFLHTVLGIALFDMTSETFSVLFKGEVSAMSYDERLYFACNNVIYTYEGGKVSQYYELPDKANQIVSLNRNGKQLYIGTESNGLYILAANGKLRHPIQKGKIGSLFRDSRKRLWAGSWDSGLYQFTNDSIIHYRHQPNEVGSISSDFVRICCEDSQGNIWIGTFNGLNRFDEKTRTFVSYLRREKESENLYYSVWSLLCDHQGTLWIGTYYGGLCCINPQKEIFRHFHASRQEQNGLSFPTVGKMIEDNQKNIWICTDGGGLNMYNPQSGNFKWYFHSDSRNSISSDNIKAFWYDSVKDVLWIGTHLGGLSRLDLKTGLFTNYYAKESKKGALRSNIISTIVPYKGKLILATQGGVMLFDPVTGNYEQLFSGPDGMISFKESDLLHPSIYFHILPYRLLVNGHEIKVGDDTGILKESITVAKKIVLKSS